MPTACPGCGEPVQNADDLSLTVSCGQCRATIIPGRADALTLVSTSTQDGGPPAISLVPLDGLFLKRYELQDMLGSGTAGAVYRARHRESGAARAIKIMHGKGADKERFLREARTLEAIRHPALIQLYEAGELDGHPYLVLEFALGGSLKKRLRDGPAFAPREALELVIPLLSGLQACHDRGVIHRDLKPDNILLTGPATGKIADLGVALLEKEERLTVTGGLVGTPLYMALEQLQGMDVDATADVHSMGLILYELITGSLPYSGANLGDLLKAKVNLQVPPIASKVPDLPAPVGAAIDAALERTAAKRPRSAEEFAQLLRRGLGAAPSRPGVKPSGALRHTPAPRSGGVRADQTLVGARREAPRPPPPPSSRGLVIAGVAVAAVALVAGALLLRPATPVPPPPPSVASPPPFASPSASPPPDVPSPTQLALVPSPEAGPPPSVALYPPEPATPTDQRVYGRCTLPGGMLVPQRFGEMCALADGTLAVSRKTSDWSVVCLEPRTLEVKSAAPLPARVTALAADGTRVYAGTEKGEVYEVSRTAGQPSRRLAAGAEPVAALAALPGGSVLVAHAGTLETRAASTGAMLRSTSWDSAIGAVAASGTQVAVGLANGALMLFAADASAPQRRVALGHDVAQVRFLPGGQQVVACDGTDSLAVVEVASGAVARVCAVKGAIRSFALTENGKVAATATERGAQLWDLGARSLMRTLETRELPLARLAIGGRDPCVLIPGDLEESTGSPTADLLVFDAEDGKPVRPSGATGPVRRCAYAQDGRTLITSGDRVPGDEQPALFGWDTATLAVRFALKAPPSYVLASDFAGKSFFMSEGASDLQQRDLADGHEIRRFPGTPVMVDVASDDGRIAMLTDAGEARLLDARTAKVLWTAAQTGFSAIHLGRDGKVVDLLRVTGPEKDASGGWTRPDAVGEVWDPVRNAVLQRQPLHFSGADNRAAFRPVLFLPGGRPVFGTAADKALAALPAAEQGAVLREACPLSTASQVSVHRAGDHLFALRMAGTEPGPARALVHWRSGGGAPEVWSPERVSPFGGCELTTLAVSPDGRRLAIGTSMAAAIELDVDRLWGRR